MLGVLCARPKPWILTSLSFVHHGSAAHHRLPGRPIDLLGSGASGEDRRLRRHHASGCRLVVSRGGAASIWHAILPSSSSSADAGGRREVLRQLVHHEQQKGEGSWNVAWDARPARWLHRSDSAWLLFGVCSCLGSQLGFPDVKSDTVSGDDDAIETRSPDTASSLDDSNPSADYRVRGVPADGRCLFRAIAHVARLRNGEQAPDEDCQTKLADELRARVVDELLERRKETEWFIDGDFDAYVDRMRKPYVWGGEPELLMASHVLKTPISVFMRDRSSSDLVNIANYGEEYRREDEIPIKVLFHGYGHYDILETV